MTHQLYLNQLGFKSNGLKAFTSTIAGNYELIDLETETTVFSGKTSPIIHDIASGQSVAKGDFSSFNKAGKYKISMEGVTHDVAFIITDQPYTAIKQALLKNFYYQRCGMTLEEAYAGAWAHDACHIAEARVYGTDEYRAQRGGWHDAGDYGKYTVAAAKAIADLLLTYDWFPDAFTDTIGIPNDSQLPDILAEVKYELDFLFQMQREDGACFHKVTTASFPPLNIMPEDDLGELIMMPISLTATAAFTACMAMAARIYHPLNPEFAERCKQAARSGWHWLEQTSLNEGFCNPHDIHTGEYGDEQWLDEIYWANAELYRLTGEQHFLQRVEQTLTKGGFPLCELGWADTGGYGTLCLLSLHDNLLPSALRNKLRKIWEEEASKYAKQSDMDGFGISLLPDEYVWGSNMVVMNRAMHLITAGKLFNNEHYLQTAWQHWHYLLGRNVMGYCYVTGFGHKPVNNIHHRPSVADDVEQQVPGMVSGGPNSGLQDEISVTTLQGQAAAACFIDHIYSYATNEMTIYWNSPTVFVAAFTDQF